MAARYLIRFDDFCPTMDRARRARNELLMRRHGIKPLVAVVPDNRDPELVREPADPEFWRNMQRLQAEEWTLGLHGFQHLPAARGRGLVPLHKRSEFAGLPEWEQRQKIECGLKILRDRGLEPSVWVAPRHGFDAATVRVLKDVGIGTISDGLAVFPHAADGVFWIPQQLWSAHERSRGVWTILVHTNTQTDLEFARLARFLEVHAREVITVKQAQSEFGARRASVEDHLFRLMWLRRHSARRLAEKSR